MANFKTLFSGRLNWFIIFCTILFLALNAKISVQAADPPEEQAAQRAADQALQAAEKAAQQAADRAAQAAADKAAQQAADKAAQQAADKATQQAADKAAQQAADKAAQQAADKAAQQAADKAAQAAADKAAQAAADKAAQQAADKAAQQAADKAAQQAADKAAQEAADKAAQEAADKASQEAADKASQEAADKASQQAADKAAQAAADKASQEAADKASQQAADKAAQQAADKAAQQAADKATQQAADKAAQQAADKAAQQAADKATQQAADKAAQEAADKAAQQAADKAAQQAAQVAAKKTADMAAQVAAKKTADMAAQISAKKAAQIAAQIAAKEAAEEAVKKAAQVTAKKTADMAAQIAAKKAAKEAAEEAAQITAKAAKKTTHPVVAQETSEHTIKETAEKTLSQNNKYAVHKTDRKKKLASIKTKRTLDALDSAMDRHREFKGIYNNNGAMAVNDELLILGRKTADLEKNNQKYHVKGQQYLKGLGMVLTRVEVSKGKKLSKSATELSGDMKSAKVDLNYLFSPSAGKMSSSAGKMPSSHKAYSVADFAGKEKINLQNTAKIHLGLIDTMINTSHPSLSGNAMTIEDFVPYDLKRPEIHGTAIASLLVGNEPSVFRGLVPGAELSAASVFFKLPSGKITATTESLILALDWLVQQRVQVINMSLSGPPNSLLAVAIKRVREKGIITVAAAGNGGPAAAPLFPAAYPGVVAVTAVNKNRHVYLRANRGKYISFSAPGVNILAAYSDGGYQAWTGTSIAAPFVSAILADEANANKSLNQGQLLKFLESNTIDLGKAGFDNTYGYGLIQAVPHR